MRDILWYFATFLAAPCLGYWAGRRDAHYRNKLEERWLRELERAERKNER